MSVIDVKNLNFIRQIPGIGARLYEAFNSLQNGVTAMAVQGNLNPTGEVDPPPAIQSVNAAGSNGMLTVSIEHTAADVNRGVRYYVEHADNPSFVNPQIRHIGDSRSFSEFVGAQTRYVRAYAAYPGSSAGPILYHGGASNPQPVDGGGSVGPPAYFPSQGSGTGAPGQGGYGPGIVSVRSDSGGFDWRKQQATGSSGGTGSPGSLNGIGSDSGSGSGGGGIVSGPSLLVDTHARRLTNYPSVKYPVNTEYYETDRTTFYWVQNASGTVTVTTGTTVTWNSGNHFINTGSGFTATQWPAGTPILINGVICRVSVVVSSTVITLQTATTNAGPVSYSVASGRWVYFGGEYASALANLPTDLGENDTVLVSSKVTIGFLFYENAAYAHQIQWNVSAWQRGPHDEEHSDTFHFCGAALTDLGWHGCDGTAAVVFMKYDGTTGTRDLPNTNSTAAYPRAAAAYSATIAAAVVPTLTMDSYTPAGTISTPTFSGSTFTPAGSVSSAFFGSSQGFSTLGFTAGVVSALVSPTSITPVGSVGSSFTGISGTPAGTISTPTFSGTPATLTGTIVFPADPVAHFSAVLMYRQ